jgi:hypothetical protein
MRRRFLLFFTLLASVSASAQLDDFSPAGISHGSFFRSPCTLEGKIDTVCTAEIYPALSRVRHFSRFLRSGPPSSRAHFPSKVSQNKESRCLGGI